MKIISRRPFVYWECTDNGHSKFWGAQIFERKGQYILIRRWGAINTVGQRMEMSFSDLYEAERVLDKLIWDKENKGYRGKW